MCLSQQPLMNSHIVPTAICVKKFATTISTLIFNFAHIPHVPIFPRIPLHIIQVMSKFPLTYRLWGLVVWAKMVKFCIAAHVRKHIASPLQTKITSHVELSHYCCLLYIFFFLGPLTKRARCDNQRPQHKGLHGNYVLVHTITHTWVSNIRPWAARQVN